MLNRIIKKSIVVIVAEKSVCPPGAESDTECYGELDDVDSDFPRCPAGVACILQPDGSEPGFCCTGK